MSASGRMLHERPGRFRTHHPVATAATVQVLWSVRDRGEGPMNYTVAGPEPFSVGIRARSAA
jgi:hypothetical protein